MQLSDPQVRSGVWAHSSFKRNAKRRIQRTGLSSMMTVYGPKSQAKKMIEGVNRMHERVRGVTDDGIEYDATDPKLLNWVFNTSKLGIYSAYDRFGPGVGQESLSEAYGVAADSAAHLFGATGPARSVEEMDAFLLLRLDNLEGHPILDEFSAIIKNTSLMPMGMSSIQRLLIRAAVSNIPEDIREKVGLDARYGLRPGEERLVRVLCSAAERIHLETHPANMAAERLGFSAERLFGRRPVNDNDPDSGAKLQHHADADIPVYEK